jgi:hypothetical protein
MTKMAGPYRFIGKAAPRKDAVEIVMGGTKYLIDLRINNGTFELFLL